jgi:hypothetical protein
MQAIIIPLYAHTTQDEVREIIQLLADNGVDGARHEVVKDERVAPFTQAQKAAREKIWFAQKVGTGITLNEDAADALWQSILSDSIAARAFTGPRYEVSV